MNPTLRLLCALGALLCAATASAGYTKIANNGAELPAGATLGSGAGDWACTRDDDTGLVWEIKTSDGGLRDQNKSYTNFDSNFPGSEALLNGARNGLVFADAVNAAGLCGYGEWRIPGKDELVALYQKVASGYFPNTPQESFWTSSIYPSAEYDFYAWSVHFLNGNALGRGRGDYLRLRLVRGGLSLSTYSLLVTATGDGGGRIGSGGIDCVRANGATAGSCAAERGRNTAVTLTATPAGGSVFAGWGGACSGSDATCTLTMDAAKTVTASFVKAKPAIAIVIDPATPTTLYAALDGAGVYASSDSGGHWSAINGGLANLDLRDLVMHDSTTLFAASYEGGVFKGSQSGGNWSWQDCGSLPDNTRLHRLGIAADGALYAGSERGIFKGSSSCDTWSAINNGLPN